MPFLSPEHIPVIRHPQGHPVDVIVSFKPNGSFRPLYVRFEDDNQERFTYKIIAVKAVKDRYMVREFLCTFAFDGISHEIVLCFDITRCLWTLG